VVDEQLGDGNGVAAQPIQAGIEHDAVQPTADGRVVAKRSGRSMCRQHRVLQGILSVVRATGGEPGQPPQPAVVAAVELTECVAITGHMCGQQLGVAAIRLSHGRTVTSGARGGTSPRRPVHRPGFAV